MTQKEFYGTFFPNLQETERLLNQLTEQYTKENSKKAEIQPVAYYSSRIKSPESMLGKLKRRKLPNDVSVAMKEFYDAVGLRIVCSFVDDVYLIADWLKNRPELKVVQVKDYIAFPKPNGYRSLHLQAEMMMESCAGMHAEIQLRTIAIDFWATLEHQLKYKQNLPHEDLIRGELKRCADEIAATDLSMQTIRDLISDNFQTQ